MSLTQQLTLEDWYALPEDDSRYECVEGILVVVPPPQRRHNNAAWHIKAALRTLVAHGFDVATELDVVLVERPLTVRRPDVAVVVAGHCLHDYAAYPDQVRVAVEILSPRSGRTDRVIKPAEYAAAGIPEYWLVDLDAPSLTCFRLGADSTYEQVAEHTGQAVAEACGVPIAIDLTTLHES